MSEAYSALKAAWHLDRIETMRQGKIANPPHVQLILSDLCNQDCHFCSYRMSNGFSSEQFVEHVDGGVNRNPNRMIVKEKAEEILRDCAALGVKAIQFTGGGEPTVHPHHLELFQLALDLGMECSLVTNGVLLRKGWQDVLPKFKWIRVSVDAGSAAVYGRVRNVPASMYYKALANMKEIGTALKGSDCYYGAGYVLTRENWQDLVPGVEAIKETGVRYVRLSAMFSKEYDAYYSGVDREIREEIVKAKRHQGPEFDVLDLYANRLTDLKEHSPDYRFCGYQQLNVYIGGNLKVYRCCNTAYTKRGEVGDLSGQSLAEWFRTKQRETAYSTFDARTCEVCQFNDKNRVINYMVSDPMHVNFV